MDEQPPVFEQLRELLDEYHFSPETLAKYLSLSTSEIEQAAQGNFDVLPDKAEDRFRLLNKICFLYLSAVEDKDVKLTAFLQVLISVHRLSKETIAKMAGVDPKDVENLLSATPRPVSDPAKYRIAVTVMALRFFLKDCEPLFG